MDGIMIGICNSLYKKYEQKFKNQQKQVKDTLKIQKIHQQHQPINSTKWHAKPNKI